MWKKRITGGIKFFVLLYLFYFVICCIVPPFFHGEAELSETFPEMEDSAGKERVLCIDDNEEALTWRLRVIEEAEKELILAAFDLRADNSGQDMMAALYHAADRGVEIMILVDGIPGTFYLRGNRMFRAFVSHPNIEVRLYNPVNLFTPWKINYRMHDKYLMADGSVFLLGGRNVNDLFLGRYREKYNVDRDILVFPEKEGGVSWQLQEYFGSIWELPCNKQLVFSQKKYAKERESLKERYENLCVSRPEAFSEVDWQGETMETNKVFLISNPIEAKNKKPVLWQEICSLAKDGERILIETPYMICDDDMYREISAWGSDGKEIRIMLNAPQGGANPFGCADYLKQKEHILETGSEIFEWAGEQSLHTKTILLDDRISIVGSFNLDIRSTYLDTETMLVIDCPALNSMLYEKALEKAEKSMHVMPDGSEYPGAKYRQGELSFFREMGSGILQVVLAPFRHLL